MHALVTGAAGFIGSHLAIELARRGHQVKGLLLPPEDDTDLRSNGVEIIRGDLTAPDTLKGICNGVDTVFHLATRTLDWGTYRQFESIMVDGTENLLMASNNDINRFVYFSSIAALGFGRELVGVKETDKRNFCGIPYCDTKIIAEDKVKEHCNQNSVAFTIIRPANVFGPGSVWVKEILDGFKRGPFPLINKGEAPGAFIYVDNLIDGAILAAESENAEDKIYHFRDDYPITWGDYVKTLGSWIGKKTFGNLPFKSAWILGNLCEKLFTRFGIRPPISRLAVSVMGLNNDVSNQLAKKELGWKSNIQLEEAMDRIKIWVEDTYMK